jgi:hypothetical protein
MDNAHAMHFLLNDPLYILLRRTAYEQQTSIANVLRTALEEYFKELYGNDLSK